MVIPLEKCIFALAKQDKVQPMAFETEIKEYEDLKTKYQAQVISKMDREEYIK